MRRLIRRVFAAKHQCSSREDDRRSINSKYAAKLHQDLPASSETNRSDRTVKIAIEQASIIMPALGI